MRPIQIDVSSTIVTTTVSTAVWEEVQSFALDATNQSVEVIVDLLNEAKETIKTEHYVINGEKYELLMSESPSFATGKPKGEFRRDDLLYVVDLIRNEGSE